MSGGIPPTMGRLDVWSALIVYGRVRRRRWWYSGWRTEERLSNKRYPIVSLYPNLVMDVAFVIIFSNAIPWFDRGIRVGTVGSWRRRLSW